MERSITRLPAEPFGRALIDAGHGAELAGTLLAFAAGSVRGWKALRAQSRRRRECIRTERLIADLPREIRADIGWPSRYRAECDSDGSR